MTRILPCLALTCLLSACAMVAEKTNLMSDADIASQTGGALGYAPADLSVLQRRTEGTNTYVLLRARDKKEFACTLNGGNLLTMGMVNPPSCTKKQ